jgi:O-antigen/teichoic acid export membrane protein
MGNGYKKSKGVFFKAFRKILLNRSSILFVFSNYLSSFLNSIRSIVVAYFLDPHTMGIWSLLLTFCSYFRYYNLGLNALAFYRSKIKRMEVAYTSYILKSNIFLSLCFALIYVLIFIFFFAPESEYFQSPEILALLFFYLIINQWAETYVTSAKIFGDFRSVAIFTVVLSILSFVFLVTFSYWFEIKGLMYGLVASIILSFFFIKGRISIHKKISFSPFSKRLLVLISNSIRIILPSLLYILFSSAEIWIIQFRFGFEETGIYSIVTTFFNKALILPVSLAVVLFTKNSHKIKENNRYVAKLTLGTFFITLITCGFGYLLLALVVNNFLPEYEKSLEILLVLVWTIPFLAIKNSLVDNLIVNKKVLLYLVFLGVLLLAKTIALIFISLHSFYIILGLTNVIYGVGLFILFSILNKNN